jgi:hypothetical protein
MELDDSVCNATGVAWDLMIKRDKRRFNLPNFATGILVTLNVPKADRLATYGKRLICRIVDISGSNRDSYILRSEFGLISRSCHIRELQEVAQTLDFSPYEQRLNDRITVRMAAKLTYERNTGMVIT